MGDRTHVQLVMEKQHYQQVKDEPWFDGPELVEDVGMPISRAHSTRNLHTESEQVSLDYDEVNYGELDFLEELVNRGIAFDSDWSDGDNYGAGTETCRFNAEGECQRLTVYDSEDSPPISQLLQLLESPDRLVDYIRNYSASRTAWPFKNQIEYGKLYLARQLISPKE